LHRGAHAEFVARAREDQAARRLATTPGFGALNATALVAAIGTSETFRRARISPPGWASCPSGDVGRGGRAHPYRLGPGLQAFEADVETRVGHVLDLACAPAHIKLFTASAVSICRRGR
jgi:transposase